MRSRVHILFAAIAVFASSLACVTIMGEDIPESAPVELPESLPPQLPQEEPVPVEQSSCPVITEQIVEANSVVYTEETAETMEYYGGRDEDTTTYLVTYLVSGDVIFDPYYEDVAPDLSLASGHLFCRRQRTGEIGNWRRLVSKRRQSAQRQQ